MADYPGWIADHAGETVVVKFGGNAMSDDVLGRAFADDVVTLARAGVRVVVTHGGGPQISAELERRGIPSEFRGGLRYTTDEAVTVVRDVLVAIGAELASQLEAAGAHAVALAGDALFAGRRTDTVVEGERVDLGRVGEVSEVDAGPVLEALEAGRVPVVSAVAFDADGGLLNVNADTAAGALAVAVGADALIVLTDVAGLYRDWPDTDSLIARITADELRGLLPGLESGMIPKMRACLDAVDGGVARASIIDGRVAHPLTREPFGASGTTVTRGEA